MTNSLSVIVPAHNAAHTLKDCLEALSNQKGVEQEYEIIVVDDGSTDDTGDLVEAAGARVIRQNNHGPASARNAGIVGASGDIVCFTDADCAPEQEWLQQITYPLLANPEIAGAKGTYCTAQTELVARFVQLEYEEKYNRLRGHSRIQFMDFYSAAFRRDILIENEGFDERFTRANSEDRELSYRMADRGFQMVFQPSAVVRHNHSAAIWPFFLKKLANGFWTAQALRRFPQRGIEDSYTPQLQKVQIGLMAFILIAAAATFFNSAAAVPLAGLMTAFLITTLPFLKHAWSRDKEVAFIAPFMLMLRAYALGLGFGWGLVRPLKQRDSTRAWDDGREA